MTKSLFLLLAGLLFFAGCAQNYVIVRSDFSRLYLNNKPKYRDGFYYFKDANGQPDRISAGRVREVAPASMVDDPNSQFKSVHAR
jgi:hypothetical protein